MAEQPTGDSSSESSIDCTINISGSPTSSPTSPMPLVRTSLSSIISDSFPPCYGQEGIEEPREGGEEGEDDGVVLAWEKYDEFDVQENESQGDLCSVEDVRKGGGEDGSCEGLVVDTECVLDELPLRKYRPEEDGTSVSDELSVSSLCDNLDALNRTIDISLVPSVEELLGSDATSQSNLDISFDQTLEHSNSLSDDPQGDLEFKEHSEILIQRDLAIPRNDNGSQDICNAIGESDDELLPSEISADSATAPEGPQNQNLWNSSAVISEPINLS